MIWKTLKLQKIKKVLESKEISLDNFFFTSNKQSITEKFPKLNLTESYLSGLIVLSIKNKMLAEFECKNLINNFSS